MLIVMVSKYPKASEILSGKSLSTDPGRPSVLAMQQRLKNAEVTNPSVRKSGTRTSNASNSWKKRLIEPQPLTCNVEIAKTAYGHCE